MDYGEEVTCDSGVEMCPNFQFQFLFSISSMPSIQQGLIFFLPRCQLNLIMEPAHYFLAIQVKTANGLCHSTSILEKSIKNGF